MVTLQDITERIQVCAVELESTHSLTTPDTIIPHVVKRKELEVLEMMRSCLQELGTEWGFECLPHYLTLFDPEFEPHSSGREWDIDMPSPDIDLVRVDERPFPYHVYFSKYYFALCHCDYRCLPDGTLVGKSPYVWPVKDFLSYGAVVKEALENVGYNFSGERMAALSQTLLKELADYYHCQGGLSVAETIEHLKTFHPSLEMTNQDWVKMRWDKLTEKERRIFQSPENYCNVIAEWYRSSKKE